jgi:hypothetical protein
MPWSVWLVLAAIIVSLTSYGALLTLILISPWIALGSYVWEWLPNETGSIADAMGIKPQYVWPSITALAAIFALAELARRKSWVGLYLHAVILLAGLFIAGAIAITRLRGFAGV